MYSIMIVIIIIILITISSSIIISVSIARIIMRPSSLGGGRILRRTLSVRLSVRPVIINERHVAPPSELK